ncbi:MAG: hypothetical protein BAJALOKI3v1_290002 [Promethearchaeota archaeon]|nr:MAG: hypothetical protein BAJALOKI3v1_290002 [Candidatus Lokiarchaeota archaeon]
MEKYKLMCETDHLMYEISRTMLYFQKSCIEKKIKIFLEIR